MAEYTIELNSGKNKGDRMFGLRYVNARIIEDLLEKYNVPHKIIKSVETTDEVISTKVFKGYPKKKFDEANKIIG